ncbi:hypothetical protein O9A_01368 [Bartonella koehlerae C-29]|uniref:Uncharacterized protein n=1 Tax=Bartonella koehlerae C-29 TaxID=1134510 RepID=A0A067W4T4_9HYPH|nr:hypothetical protein O9A_01368 [Bartonella koehlerae C-29]
MCERIKILLVIFFEKIYVILNGDLMVRVLLLLGNSVTFIHKSCE